MAQCFTGLAAVINMIPWWTVLVLQVACSLSSESVAGIRQFELILESRRKGGKSDDDWTSVRRVILDVLERSQIPHCCWSSWSCCVEILGHANRNTKDSSPSLTKCVINNKWYLFWHLCLVIHERWRLKYEVNPNTECLWWMVGFLLLLLIVL